MTIAHDDCDERQTRVDLMIDEFRQAQSRRLARAPTVTADDRLMELQRDAVTADAAIAGSASIPTSD